MPVTNLNANFIAAQGGGYEPQRQNNGQITIMGLQGIAGINTDVLTLAAKQFPLPKRTTGVITLGYLNEERHVAGRTKYDPLTWVFHDYVDKPIAIILHKWYQAVQDHITGKTGFARDYKKTVLMDIYSPDLVSIDRQYQLIGCFPTSMDPGEIDNDAEGEVLINIVIQLDKYFPIFAGIAPPGTGGVLGPPSGSGG